MIATASKTTKDCAEILSDRSGIIVLIFCVFFGGFGLHRFYVGKKVSGILYLCTGGLLGLGIIYDLFLIVLGKFTDNKGRLVETNASW